MNREDAKRLVQGFLGKQQVPDFGLEEPEKSSLFAPCWKSW